MTLTLAQKLSVQADAQRRIRSASPDSTVNDIRHDLTVWATNDERAARTITTQQEQIKALSEALIATHTQVYNARECVGDDERMEYLANASNIIGAALTQQGAMDDE